MAHDLEEIATGAHFGPYQLPGVVTPSWLLRFDAQGTCLSPKTWQLLLDDLKTREPHHLILFSHGWNNDFDEAVALYAKFMRSLEQLGDSGTPLPILFIGVIWPSSWLPRHAGPVIAAAEADIEPHNFDPDSPDPAVAMLAAMQPAERARVATLLRQPRLVGDEATELAAYVAAALSGNGVQEGAEIAGAPAAEDVLAAVVTLTERDGAPPADPEDFGTIDAGVAYPVASDLQTAGLFPIDPRQAIRVFSLYQMKDRAGRVGSSGVSALVRDILALPGHRLHGVGHSFGSKVLLSATCVGAAPPRALDSLLLLEPAISHLCFSAQVPGRSGPGGYRTALAPGLVRQPIFSTHSAHDFPLHAIFHLALRRASDLGELGIAAAQNGAGEPPSRYCALGGYGARGAGEVLINPLPRAGEAYALSQGHRLYCFDGTADRRIDGHGDVATEFTAWALLQQLRG
jgi:hypothetical protein